MVNDTKERILSAALDVFSQKGYDGTNIRELMGIITLVIGAGRILVLPMQGAPIDASIFQPKDVLLESN